MKKLISFVAVLCVLTLCVGALVACGNEDPPVVDNRLTITWYNGSDVLRTDKVDKGTSIDKWKPVNEGYAFVKWCSDKELTKAAEFPYVVNENVAFYAEFKGPKVDDTRQWYLLGEGKGSLKNTSLDINTPSESLKMEKIEDNDTNIYKLQNIVLYQGDEFVFAAKGVSKSEHGIGYFEKFNDQTKDVAIDGVTYFVSKANNTSDNLCFAKVNVSGTYTLILSTNPNEERYDNVTFTKTDEAPQLKNSYDMHIQCQANSFGTIDGFALLEKYKLNVIPGQEGKYLAELTISEENYEAGKDYAVFSLVNLSDNNVFNNEYKLTKGTYHIMFDSNKTEQQTSCKELAYYVVGTFVENNEKVYYTIKENVTPKMVQEGNEYKVTFTSTNVTEIYNDIDYLDPSLGIMHIMVGYGTEFYTKTLHGTADDDVIYLQKGTYEVTFTRFPIAVTVKQVQ